MCVADLSFDFRNSDAIAVERGIVMRFARALVRRRIEFCYIPSCRLRRSCFHFPTQRSFGTHHRFEMPSKDKYTDPELRDEVKEEIHQSDKGGAPGQWSARKVGYLPKAMHRQLTLQQRRK